MRVPGFFDSPLPLAFAHRGGAGTGDNVGIENSMAAFRDAYERGFRHLETDVRCSSDGVVYAVHDETLKRLTGNPRAVAEMSSAELDAELLDGREPIPRLAELYEAFPGARLNIDVKSDDALEPTCAVIEEREAVDRTCLASFSQARLDHIRRRLPGTATSASAREAALVKLLPAPLLRRFSPPVARCLQVPVHRFGIRVVTRRFIARAHVLGLQVHVWTVDDAETMNELLNLGVDGIITDRTDVLKDVLIARGTWRAET